MKTKIPIVLALLSTLNALRSTCHAQGSLAPPGPPAPTMKTLQHVEPRTPISSLPAFISDPGSYYLTTNLTGAPGNYGIAVTAENVTLDLNGFMITGVSNAFQGIAVFGQRNVCVRNGTVRNWPQGGIGGLNGGRYERLFVTDNAGSGLAVFDDSIVSDCILARNAGLGLSVGNGSTVRDCVVSLTTGGGIGVGDGCTLNSCVAFSNTFTGITIGNGSIIKDSSAFGNGAGGLVIGQGSIANGCTVRANIGVGISLASGGTVVGCAVSTNTDTGIVLSTNGLVMFNSCFNNGVFGISARNGGGNRIEANNVGGNTAISSTYTNLVIRNSWSSSDFGAIANGTFYGNVEASSAAMNANKNPHANFFIPR